MSNAIVESNNGAPPKTYDRTTGIQVIRGGQAVGDNFFSSVQSAYANLAYAPLSLTIMILSIIVMTCSALHVKGPLEVASEYLAEKLKDPKLVDPWKTIASFILTLLMEIIPYRLLGAGVFLAWFPYFAKPSTRNMTISIIISLFVIMSTFTLLKLIILTQVYFLFTSMRAPTHKIILLVVLVVAFVNKGVDLSKSSGTLTALSNMDTSEHVFFMTKEADKGKVKPTVKREVLDQLSAEQLEQLHEIYMRTQESMTMPPTTPASPTTSTTVKPQEKTKTEAPYASSRPIAVAPKKP